MKFSSYKLEKEEYFTEAFEAAAELVRRNHQGDYENILTADYLHWGGDPDQLDDMLAAFRDYCDKPTPEVHFDVLPQRKMPSWMCDVTNNPVRRIIDSLKEEHLCWFRAEYLDCIRATKAVVKNDPPTRAARNKKLKRLAKLKSSKSIQANLEAMDEITLQNIKLTMDLKKCTMAEACNLIDDGVRVRTPDPFTYVEERLTWAYLTAGGIISKYNDNQLSYSGDFAKLLRQFRDDCGEIGHYRGSVSKSHISNLLDVAEKLVHIEEDPVI
jgi:hypothetical protein